jgi:hypothetical protein
VTGLSRPAEPGTAASATRDPAVPGCRSGGSTEGATVGISTDGWGTFDSGAVARPTGTLDAE